MKFTRCLLLLSLGAGLVLLYQKYGKKVMEKMETKIGITMDNIEDELEEMM